MGKTSVILSKRIIASVVALVLLFGILTLIPKVNAQDGGSGLQISPTKTEISALPGEEKSFTINIKNITKNTLLAKAVVNDFKSDNESGSPQILTDTKDRTPYSLSNMLKGLQDVQLKPGEVKQVKLTLSVPAGSAPGAYFGAVRYSAVPDSRNPESQGEQVTLNASVAHLVFLELPGDVLEQIKVESLKAERGDNKGWFFLKAPQKSAVGIKNLGNGFARPVGSVTIKNMFGSEVYNYDVNNTDPKSVILPKSSRTFTKDIKSIKWPGRYTQSASIAYGSGSEVVGYKSSFWYVPVWAIIALVVLMLVIVGASYTVYRRKFKTRRKY